MAIQTNLYDYKCYFALIIDNVVHEIAEPRGWAQIINHIPRDKDGFGFTADFIEDKVGMLFTMPEGGQLLKDVALSVGYGPDTVVIFQFGEKRNNTRIPLYSGQVYLHDYSGDFGGVSTSIEKMPFQGRFRSRKTAPCQINGYSTFDKQLLEPISVWAVRLHSKAIQETSQQRYDEPQQSNEQIDGGGVAYNLWVAPYTNSPTTNELKDFITEPVAIINATAVDIYADRLFQFKPTTNGGTDVTWSGKTNLYFYANWDYAGILSPSPGSYYRVTPELVHRRLVGGIYETINTYTGTYTDIYGLNGVASHYIPNGFAWINYTGTPTLYVTNTTCVYAGQVYLCISPIANSTTPPPSDPTHWTAYVGDTVPLYVPSYIFKGHGGSLPDDLVFGYEYTWDESWSNIELQTNDEVYIHLKMEWNYSGSGLIRIYYVIADEYVNDLKITQRTLTESTNANGYRIFDVINQSLEIITGAKNRLVSTFFSQGGFGYEYLLCNGYGIRNFGVAGYGFTKALGELLTDLQCIFGIGWGFKTVDGIEYLVVEHLSYFFQNKIIAIFDNTFEWHDTIGSNYCYSQALLGYSKFAQNERTMIDEFCTDGSYQFQNLKMQSNVLNKRSNIIASGYTLEDQRRNQFLQNPSLSLIYDNDIFIVACNSSLVLPEIPVTFLDGGGNPPFSAIFNVPMGMLPGDRFTTDSGLNAGTEFTITLYGAGYPFVDGSDGYNITPQPLVEYVTTTITIIPPSPNIIFAERNEPFEICANVLNPQSIYNGRLSLKHILYNWSPLLSVGLYYVYPTSLDFNNSQIITTLAKNNNQFTSKFRSTEPNKGYIGTLTTVEQTNEPVGKYVQNQAIFTPNGGTCKAYIGWNDFNDLKSKLTGAANSPVDFGGIVLNDDNGLYWFCHVMDMQYNPVTQIITFEVQKVYQVWDKNNIPLPTTLRIHSDPYSDLYN